MTSDTPTQRSRGRQSALTRPFLPAPAPNHGLAPTHVGGYPGVGFTLAPTHVGGYPGVGFTLAPTHVGGYAGVGATSTIVAADVSPR